MKKIILIIFTIISINGLAQTTELKLISDVWPPFTNVETEDSFATDLVKEALNRINIQVTIEITEFSNIITDINSGKFEGSAALWLTEEREKNYIFSKPYLQNQLILVGHKGKDMSKVSFSELKGKRIGVIENYAYGNELYEDKGIIVVSGESNQDNLENLLSNKIDYMLVDALLIQYMLKYQVNDVSEYLAIGSEPLLIKSLHFVLRKDISNSEQIISRFNVEIQNMISDGTYHKILNLNWIQTDIDGDGNMELVLKGNEAGIKAPKIAYGVTTETADIMRINRPDRYYINGVMYNGWENVPTRFKVEDTSLKYPHKRDEVLKFKF
jgi:ABC-type amino acid transport substrate-binding protein